jgi:serine/threonine protein kinase
VDEVVFGRYRLLSVIGQGGMGTVYKGHDTVIGRDVAVKVLPTELGSEPGYRERFRREAHIAARLTEPHIIPIHDTGEIDGRLYLVMPVIEGIDVAGLLARDGPMSPRRAVAVVDQLAAALDAAHAVGLVHRDVKPSNALLTGRDFVYLIDFGIAHDGAATKLTGTGMIVGTLAYMAPERFTAGTADARSDVYALTCVLHECLTGDQPFPGGSMEQQIAGHLTMDPPRPSAQRAAVPAGFDEVIAAGMAKDPDRRYQSAHELATAADRALTAAPARTPRPAPAPTLHDRLPPQPPPEPVRQPAGDLHLAATHQRPPSWPPGPQPAARRPVLTTLQLWSLIAVIAVTAVVVITIVIRSSAQHPSASQTPTTQPAPSPAPTAQPAPLTQPAAATPQYFKTPWGTRCQVDADQVICDTCEPGLVLDTPHTDCPGPGPNELVVNAYGASQSPAAGAIIGASPGIQQLASGQTYHANGWTIAVNDWVRFTNDATGHGMAVAAQNYEFI